MITQINRPRHVVTLRLRPALFQVAQAVNALLRSQGKTLRDRHVTDRRTLVARRPPFPPQGCTGRQRAVPLITQPCTVIQVGDVRTLPTFRPFRALPQVAEAVNALSRGHAHSELLHSKLAQVVDAGQERPGSHVSTPQYRAVIEAEKRRVAWRKWVGLGGAGRGQGRVRFAGCIWVGNGASRGPVRQGLRERCVQLGPPARPTTLRL